MIAHAQGSATLKMATKGHESHSGWEGTQIASEGSIRWPGSKRGLRKGVLDRCAEANGMNYNETECHVPTLPAMISGGGRGLWQSERKTMEREQTGGCG